MYICLCVYIMYMYVHVGMYVYIMYVCMYVFVYIYRRFYARYVPFYLLGVLQDQRCCSCTSACAADAMIKKASKFF